MKKSDLISYACSFVSFLIKKKPLIERIILFGSVASGNFDEDSDIDIFVDTSHSKKEIMAILDLYEKSEDNHKYFLEGIKNHISLKVGNLEQWGIKRSIISGGITLYGPYQELPKGLHHYALFVTSSPLQKRKDQIKVWRILYGYTQKIGSKRYAKEGLIRELSGKKLTRGAFIIPFEKSTEIIKLLKNQKVKYSIFEIFK
jgi:predicted nucleotidyltransferase